MSTDDKTPAAEAAELRSQLEGLRATDPAPHVEALKQQAADTAHGVADSVSQTASGVADSVSQTAATARDTVASAAASVRDTVVNATAKVADTVVPPLRQGADAVRGAVAGARSTAAQVSDGTEALSERVRDQPFLALGLAAFTGYVLGRAFR